MSVDLFKVEEDAIKLMYEHFNRTKEEVDEDVEAIRRWLKSQPHLPEIMSEKKIRNFLFLNKFQIEKTKKKIDMYYTVRSLIPDFFDECNPKCEKLQKYMKTSISAIHPKLVKGLYRAHFVATTPNNYQQRDACVQYFNMLEVRLEDDRMFSDIYLMDFGNFTFYDFAKITLPVSEKYLKIYKNVFSLRIQEIHLFNCPPAIDIVSKIIKLFVKPKIFARLQVHKDAEFLKEMFEEDDLPKDYGGKGLSLRQLNDLMSAEFEKYANRFDLLDTFRVDENLRPEPLQNDELLGFYGNFKQLTCD